MDLASYFDVAEKSWNGKAVKNKVSNKEYHITKKNNKEFGYTYLKISFDSSILTSKQIDGYSQAPYEAIEFKESNYKAFEESNISILLARVLILISIGLIIYFYTLKYKYKNS